MVENFIFNLACLLLRGMACALILCDTLAPVILCTDFHGFLALSVSRGTSWLVFIVLNFDCRIAVALLDGVSALWDRT